MVRPREPSPSDTAATRLKDMMLREEILQEYRDQLAKFKKLDDESTDHRVARDMAKFSDMTACQSLRICTPSAPDGSLFYGVETGSGPVELLFYDICFVKSSFLPPLPERQYKSPGTLYHSVSLVAPPGERRMSEVASALENLYLRMSTSSASRNFAEFSIRPWITDDTHGELRELFLTSRAFTHTEDIKAGRVKSKACVIPAELDSNGCLHRLIDASKGSLCFTSDNMFRVCDLTVSPDSPRAAQFPSPDVVVAGQLVYVTYSLRGSVAKPAVTKGRRAAKSSWHYTFKPTLRSLFILSKSGPVVMKRSALYKAPVVLEAGRMEETLPDPDESDVDRDLKRLRMDPPR
ncbi:unnamed protein product [Peniophora sp. CBMAI 1063]|nr:unnamed protein product [Peniophora sp. CBMAI 1063]